MGRKSNYCVGQFFGKLEVREVLPSKGSGSHVSLRCLCHYCSEEKIMSAVNIKKRNSCGCQQKNSSEWKSKGPKLMPWQLPKGESARRSLENQYKKGAIKRNLDYNLTTEEFNVLVAGNCVYCGDSLSNTIKGQGKTSGDFKYTGIDRLDSSKGYSKENCVSCCWTCNNMKHITKQEDFLNHIEKIFQYRKQ
jgi:hypothetical protein